MGGGGLTGSVSAEGFAERFIKAALDSFGGIDIIINDAGYTWDSVIQKMTDEQWQGMLDLHLTAPFKILRAASAFIRNAAKRGGRRRKGNIPQGREHLIHCRIGGQRRTGKLRNRKGQLLVGLTKTLCKEWGRYKVNVNCVAFGLIQTRLSQSLTSTNGKINIEGRDIKVGIRSDFIKRMRENMILLGRAGTPTEAADAVYLFLLPESSCISGQTVVCGGGLKW